MFLIVSHLLWKSKHIKNMHSLLHLTTTLFFQVSLVEGETFEIMEDIALIKLDTISNQLLHIALKIVRIRKGTVFQTMLVTVKS